MNLKSFQRLYSHAEFDEVYIIGKDIEKEGKPYHMLGLTLQNQHAVLYVLELGESFLGKVALTEKTRREQFESSIQAERNRSFFMGIRSFQNQGKEYEVSGAQSGNCANGNCSEVYILFFKMLQAGWRVEKDSPFYELSWEQLVLTRIELREEMEHLPKWQGELQVESDCVRQEYVVAQPVSLELGKQAKVMFSVQDGSSAICYISKVQMMDVWAENRKRFEDADYRERMLQHMSREQFEQMKEQLFEVLLETCPEGMCFPVIEYECTGDLGLRFYNREYLDTTEAPKKGSAAAILMNAKPDVETGTHGLKMRACIIQTPMENTVKNIDAELFSYAEVMPRRVEVIEL